MDASGAVTSYDFYVNYIASISFVLYTEHNLLLIVT